jgi:transposase-like protein
MEQLKQDTPRRKLSPDQKFKIIKEQMTTKTSISDICKKYEIVPSQFYKWQEKFLTGALDGFKKSDDGPTKAELRKIEELEKKNTRMQSVITEIVQENIELKKSLGDSGLL